MKMPFRFSLKPVKWASLTLKLIKPTCLSPEWKNVCDFYSFLWQQAEKVVLCDSVWTKTSDFPFKSWSVSLENVKKKS